LVRVRSKGACGTKVSREKDFVPRLVEQPIAKTSVPVSLGPTVLNKDRVPKLMVLTMFENLRKPFHQPIQKAYKQEVYKVVACG